MQHSAQMNCLCQAVCNNDLFSLQEVLMEGELDVNEPLMLGLTALHIAAEKGYSSCVTVLLSAGAKVDIQDMHGQTPLMTGIRADYPLVTRQLLKTSADPNIIDYNTYTALHYACQCGNDGIVTMLLSANANPNVQTTIDLQSPLSIAISQGCTDIVRTLLLGDMYVNPRSYAQSAEHKHPLSKSIEDGHFAIAKLLILAGYSALPELKPHVKDAINVDDTSDLSAWEFVRTFGPQPLTLQSQCCLAVRRCLRCNIAKKVQQLQIPVILQNFVTFREEYTPPKLHSDTEIYNYFENYAGLRD